MHVLITRPEEDAAPLAAALISAGVQSTTEPLLNIVYKNSGLPKLSAVQGLLITSANGIRAFARLTDNRDMPVWAVGDASARISRELGFAQVQSASGDVDALAGLVRDNADPAAGPLLHVAGTKLAGDLAGQLEGDGFGYLRCVLYSAETSGRLSDAVIARITEGPLDGVLLYSPRTAATFCTLVKSAGLSDMVVSLTAFCLSPAVADNIADLVWRDVVIAPMPDEASLIAKVLETAARV